MKKLITYGTFDMFHIGHLNLLESLKSIADEVVVGVSTDEFNLEKGKKTLIPFEQRAKIVESIRYVDKVIPENSWEQKEIDIKKYAIDIFAIGDDWKGRFDHLSGLCKVVYLPRTPGVSTTKLKSSLDKLLSVPREDLLFALDTLETIRNDIA